MGTPGARESEDLPVVSGAPRPAVHRLGEWACRPGRAPVVGWARGGVPVRRWWSIHRSKWRRREHHPIHRDRAGHAPDRSEPRTQEGRRGLLGRATRRAGRGRRRRRPAPAGLDRAARRRDRFDPGQHLLLLRPGARHRRDARRRARTGSPAIADPLDPTSPLARGTDASRTTGDDQVVRHQLPLPGPGDLRRGRRSASMRRRRWANYAEARAARHRRAAGRCSGR